MRRDAYRLARKVSAATMPGNQGWSIDTHEKIAEAEDLITDREFRQLAAALAPMLEVATVSHVKSEIAVLLAAYPTKEDLRLFTALAVEEIASDPPTRLTLAAACRDLRRTAKFRPSIAEILAAVKAVRRNTALENNARQIVRLPARTSSGPRSAPSLAHRSAPHDYGDAGVLLRDAICGGKTPKFGRPRDV